MSWGLASKDVVMGTWCTYGWGVVRESRKQKMQPDPGASHGLEKAAHKGLRGQVSAWLSWKQTVLSKSLGDRHSVSTFCTWQFLKLCFGSRGEPLSKSITFSECLACRQRQIDGRGKTSGYFRLNPARNIAGKQNWADQRNEYFSQRSVLGRWCEMKVPSTSNPEILITVNACTDEVRNCRQIAATNTVIRMENQINEIGQKHNEGEVVGLGASVGKGVEKCGDNCGSSKVRWNMDEMEWFLKKDKTTTQLKSSWATCTREKLSVCHVLNARGAV